jgi:long-chain acyl-CoA synthetase
VKLLSSGSAPLSADVMDFLKVALGCHVIEGNTQSLPLSRHVHVLTAFDRVRHD